MAVCKKCKNQIPDGSVFCMFCGTKQIAAPRKKAAEKTVTVPKPRQLPSGRWFIQLRRESVCVTEDTPELCVAKAQAIRAGFFEGKKATSGLTVKNALTAYTEKRSEILSPATLRGYDNIIQHRFAAYSKADISSVDWQKAINAEATHCSAKTLRNAWGLVAAALKENNLPVPNVTLPPMIKRDLPWLDYAQIQTFLAAAYGQPGEMAALLALHSLRLSELLAVDAAKVSKTTITVDGAYVTDKDENLVYKATNKNATSRRTVPIMIPRMLELVPETGPLVSCTPNTVYRRINAICENAGLPLVGVHGLRRSFASLAYHLGWSELETMRVGGWADFATMRQIYTKLSSKDMTKAVKKMQKYYAK